MKHYTVPLAHCPQCGSPNDCASGIERRPVPGDLSICIRCATVARFTDQMELRRLTAEEEAEMPAHIAAQVFQFQMAVEIAKRDVGRK